MTSLVCTVLLVAALQTQENTLIASAELGNTSQVVSALRDGSPIDARDERGRTALIVASAAGHLDVVRVLIAKGAELNAQADNGWSALAFAEAEGYPRIVEFVLARGGKWLPPGEAGRAAAEKLWASTDRSWDVEPTLVHKPPDPSYPKRARKEKISGNVILRVKVLTDGTTELRGVIQPLLHCTRTAKENALKWRWEPAQKAGEPVEAFGIITVSFDIFQKR